MKTFQLILILSKQLNDYLSPDLKACHSEPIFVYVFFLYVCVTIRPLILDLDSTLAAQAFPVISSERDVHEVECRSHWHICQTVPAFFVYLATALVAYLLTLYCTGRELPCLVVNQAKSDQRNSVPSLVFSE